MMAKMTMQLDDFDQKLLAALSRDGRMTVTDLAREVGLSKTPVQARLKRLEAEGVILGYAPRLDPAKLGLPHIAFVEVKLRDTREASLRAFNDAVAGLVEVEECHMIAGAFDYLLKVRTRDMVSYRTVLGEKISSLPHVSHTSTHVAMQAVKDIGLGA